MHLRRMATDNSIKWTGTGRWLSFVAAGLLIVLAIPLVFDHASGAAAGWNIFLGLLLCGAIASGNASAPAIATTIAVLIVVRLLVAVAFDAGPADIVAGVLLLAIVSASAWDLRKQRNQP